MSDSKASGSAYGLKAGQSSFRRTWDKDEYAAKAKEIDKEAYEHAKEAEKAMQAGKKPPRAKRNLDIPKPTESLKAREHDVVAEIQKNMNKTMLVSSAGRGPGAAGFYCELCKRTLKDSVAYLDHVNGRSHLARLGQTTQVGRASLADVRARIALVREQKENKVTSQNFDFEKRLQAIKEQEARAREERKENKKRKREEAAAQAAATAKTSNGDGMSAMMGFGGFGGGKKR